MIFNFEIDISNFQYDPTDSKWYGYDRLTTEGNSLAELGKNISIWLLDQDGGDDKELGLQDVPVSDREKFVDLIIAQYESVEKIYEVKFSTDKNKATYSTEVVAKIDIEAAAEAKSRLETEFPDLNLSLLQIKVLNTKADKINFTKHYGSE